GGGEPNSINPGLDQIPATTSAAAAAHEGHTCTAATPAATTCSPGSTTGSTRVFPAACCQTAAPARSCRRASHAPLEAIHAGLDLHIHRAGYPIVLQKLDRACAQISL